MNSLGAFGAYRRAEGVPVFGVYYNRASSQVPGGELGLRAGAGGAAIGRFGWAAPDGTVLNARTSDQDQLGLIVTRYGDWRSVYWDDLTHTWRIRQGLNLTMLAASPGFWMRIPGGGSWGAAIYADPTDGTPVAEAADGLELSRWVVGSRCGADGLFFVTTWNLPI